MGNQLIGMQYEEEEMVEENADWWPRRMFHKDCPDGERFMTKESQDEALKEGWVMEKSELGKKKKSPERQKRVKPDEESFFSSLGDDGSKIDVSPKKTKSKKKG